ncbi:MAG TPA: hypothetical protein PKJ04_06755 [Nitrospira sp.]|nr:hypothetical protein [Nitrospira sp.]MBS0173087.1 hypothetical protein [Nitrospira sp.]MBS0179044.1 hypothetical protein [Nitrospira sp.]MBX3338435.1 hypothetical protein [Nitrospira sp.]MCW5781474.1 hypothetical protein [Nitrospira sp.]
MWRTGGRLKMNWGSRPLKWIGLGSMLLSGCTTVAQITTLSDESCHRTVQGQLESILLEEGETPEVANRLAVNTTVVLATGSLGPRPFGVSSPSGADYSFFVQLKGDQCLLRLYGRRKGFTRYTNNLTYIATRSLNGCACAE